MKRDYAKTPFIRYTWPHFARFLPFHRATDKHRPGIIDDRVGQRCRLCPARAGKWVPPDTHTRRSSGVLLTASACLIKLISIDGWRGKGGRAALPRGPGYVLSPAQRLRQRGLAGSKHALLALSLSRSDTGYRRMRALDNNIGGRPRALAWVLVVLEKLHV